MKRTHIIVVSALLLLSVFSLHAQNAYMNDISLENISITKKAGVSAVAFDVNLDKLHIDKNQMLVITPVITSFDNQHSEELAPVVILGSKRDKILNRPYTWKGKTEISPESTQLVRKNATAQSIHYSNTLPFAPWQRQARLVLNAKVIGCADCVKDDLTKNISEKIFPDVFVPDYRMPYIEPEVEPVKQRSETYSAHFKYKVGKHDLLPNFENNAAELAKVDKYIRELQADKDLTITDFTISGYASPEDTEARNLMLSQRRAETFAKYIEKKYGYKRDRLKVEWFGEDWKGLREAVAASNLDNKNEIIAIIDNSSALDAKDAQIIALDNGKTYNRLLNKFYPPLRRNDYTLAFISRAFNVEEAKEVIKKNPKKLSLNEMFLVANTYPADSPEYSETFIVACKTFPNSEVACINAAVGELRRDNPDEAMMYLREINDNAQALNLMGIAYAKKGDTARATDFFNKARQQGNTDAAHNAEQLQQYINDNL